MNKKTTFPKSIGIILDGNRRWARERGLPTLEGHRKGLENFVTIAKHAQKVGMEHLVVYAFSTENWNRTKEEVEYLMNLFREMFSEKLDELKEENMRVRVIGQKERFDSDLQEIIKKSEEDTKNAIGLNVWIALSYGGRAEIAQAVSVACKEGDISEESIAKNMWSAGMPDPDIVVRPGGERRISNFLIWQIAYSELFFVDKYWPAFTTDDFDAILKEYEQRERRRGK